MMLALAENGERIYASNGGAGVCPSCRDEVIPKCGEINIHHWAHKQSDCDTWAEGETEWHAGWKSKFPKDNQEVIVGPHRADVLIDGHVFEFQRSSISSTEIREREEFYTAGGLSFTWVVEAGCFYENLDLRPRDGYVSFRWKWPRKCWWGANERLVFHFSHGEPPGPYPWLFEVRKIYSDTPCGGWGQSLNMEKLCKHFLNPERSKLWKRND